MENRKNTTVWKMQKRKCYCVVAVLVLVLIGTGFLIGWLVASHVTNTPSNDAQESSYQEIKEKLLGKISAQNIKKTLRNVSSQPRMAGTVENERWAQYLRELWLDQGLDDTGIDTYNVLLSYPGNQSQPNKVQILNANGSVYRDSLDIEELPGSSVSNAGLPAYAAYSKGGVVEGDLVYVNCASEADLVFVTLNCSIDVRGKILVSRATGEPLSSKLQHAAAYGASALLTFMDPWMDPLHPPPSNTVQRGTTRPVIGDPLTPHYPAKEYPNWPPDSGRWADQAESPIPVQPISYDMARELFRSMEQPGLPLPSNWKYWPFVDDTLRATHSLSSKMVQNRRVRVEVHNRLEMRPIHNVCGLIRGALEPDRLVILGNHRDSWVYGAADPGGGTAIIMELVQAFGQLKREGWRPRRTLMFCSWDAEEFALIGSTEWVEDKLQMLSHKAVAYLNIDSVVAGNQFLHVAASPLLHTLIMDTVKQVPHPGFDSVYDAWLNQSAMQGYSRPWMDHMLFNSDTAGFNLVAGVPSVDMYYQENMHSYYSVYHTAADTFDYVSSYVDPTFELHAAMAGVYGVLARELVDRPLLPMGVLDYVKTIAGSYANFWKNLMGVPEEVLQFISSDQGRVWYATLGQCLERFSAFAVTFQSSLATVNYSDAMRLRGLNDKLMLMERAFINNNWQSPAMNTRHVLFSPSLGQCRLFSCFPGINSALCDPEAGPGRGSHHPVLSRVQQEVRVICQALNAAIDILAI